MDPEYDQAVSDVASSKKALDEYLDKQRQRLGCKVWEISFVKLVESSTALCDTFGEGFYGILTRPICFF